MNKTGLVAQREFMENMKTKTFWLGIFAAPIMICLFYGGMFLLANKTDIRKYAVLDHSKSAEFGDAWLSERIREKVSKGQLSEILDKINGTPEEQQSVQQDFEKMFSNLEADHPIRDLLNRLDKAGYLKAVQGAGKDVSKLPAGAMVVLSKWLLEIQFNSTKKNQIADLVNSFQGKDFQLVDTQDLGEDPEQSLNDMLQDEEIFAYIVIGEDPLDDRHGSKYVSQNVADRKLRSWYENMVSSILRSEHIRALKKDKNLSDQDVNNIERQFSFEEKKLSDSGEEEDVEIADKTRQFAPIAFVYALWMSIFIAAQMLLTNTVEEKSNRVIEVLLSSVSPTQLMNGKIFGIAATGLTIVGSWTLFLVGGIKLAPLVLPADANANIADLGLNYIATDPIFLSSFLCYFLTGYLFYAALLVAIGSVCNSLKEAQNLQQPVVFLLFVPFATMIPIAQDPNGTLAKVITYIPFYTPFAMMNRAGSPPPLWEYLASSALILVSLWIAFRGAAKVFRVGILMTGKPPKIREIIKWMRAPTR